MAYYAGDRVAFFTFGSWGLGPYITWRQGCCYSGSRSGSVVSGTPLWLLRRQVLQSGLAVDIDEPSLRLLGRLKKILPLSCHPRSLYVWGPNGGTCGWYDRRPGFRCFRIAFRKVQQHPEPYLKPRPVPLKPVSLLRYTTVNKSVRMTNIQGALMHPQLAVMMPGSTAFP